MSIMPKAAALFGVAGVLFLMVAVLVGPPDRNDHSLVDASFACLILAGVSLFVHVLVNLWHDFTDPAIRTGACAEQVAGLPKRKAVEATALARLEATVSAGPTSRFGRVSAAAYSRERRRGDQVDPKSMAREFSLCRVPDNSEHGPTSGRTCRQGGLTMPSRSCSKYPKQRTCRRMRADRPGRTTATCSANGGLLAFREWE